MGSRHVAIAAASSSLTPVPTPANMTVMGRDGYCYDAVTVV
jgi:di/tricarboxylate transporter